MITRALNISKRAYLYHKKQGITDSEKVIEESVINCFHKHKGIHDRPRIKKDLETEYGIYISEGKIYRIMKENGLVGLAGRKRKNKKPKLTEEEKLKLQLQQNLIKKKDLNKLEKHEVLVSDITEIKIRNGNKTYLTAIMDVSSRKILGYHLSSNMTQDIVHKSLKMALSKIQRLEGIIFHSDRGSQYTSKDTQNILRNHNMIMSMSRPGKPNDNQMIESFWNTLKTELGSLKHLSRYQANTEILKYINYYNTRRIHSSLEYKSPEKIYNEKKEFKRVTKI